MRSKYEKPDRNMYTMFKRPGTVSSSSSINYETVHRYNVVPTTMDRRPISLSQSSTQKKTIRMVKLESALLSDVERSSAFSIIFMGETGSGKSTLINALVNYFMGVELESEFRYYVIDESHLNRRPGQSQTRTVNEYIIKSMKSVRPIILIDTPGFADTDGIKADLANREAIFDYLLKNPYTLNAICFVKKANDNKLTSVQQYIAFNVLQAFGNDAINNIFVMFTFCDNGKPKGLAPLLESKVPFKQYYKFNNSGIFPQKDGDKFEPYDPTDGFTKLFWEVCMESNKQFIASIFQTQSISLSMTQDVIKQRKRLESILMNVNLAISEGLVNMSNIQNLLNKIQQNQKLIEENKNFTFVNKKVKNIHEKKDHPTTICRTCQVTCHADCAFEKDEDKDKCSSMSNNHCKICRLHCHWSNHTNTYTVIKQVVVDEILEFADKKDMLLKGKNDVNQTKFMVKNLEEDYSKKRDEVVKRLNEAKSCITALNNIALRPNKMELKEYIELVITNEKENKSNGWMERLSELESIKKQLDTLNIINNLPSEDEFIKLAIGETMKSLIEKVKTQQALSEKSIETILNSK